MSKAKARKIAGYTSLISFILAMGKVGASDCGATWSEFFPGLVFYMILFIVSFLIWEKCGGNDPAVIYNNEIKSIKRNQKILEKTLDFLVIVCYIIYRKIQKRKAEIRQITRKSSY